MEAIHRFRAAQSDQMTESDRALLVERMKGILDDEQREDLRAALDRRPIVKQTGFTLVNAVRDVRVVPATQPGPTFQIQNLLLTK